MASLPTGTFFNAEAIYKGLLAMGLNPNAAAGVAGNIYQESHGNPAAYSPAGGGLFGLTNANGGNPSGGSLSYELSKLLAYIKANGSIANVNANAPDPATAALYFSNHYERPNAYYANNSVRQQAALWIAQAAKSGNWSAGSPANKTPPGSHTSTSTIPPTTTTPTGGTTVPSGAQPATLTGFPGGVWDPLNLPGEIASALNLPGAVSSVLNPAKWLGDLMNSALARDMFKRLGLIVLGGILVIAGVIILSGRDVAQAAKTMVAV